MAVVSDLYFWTDWVLFFAMLVLRLWALIDCAIRKTAAFEATNRLTKPGWLAILGVSLVLGYFLSTYFGLLLCIPALIYLVDVRPAVKEVSGGSRW